MRRAASGLCAALALALPAAAAPLAATPAAAGSVTAPIQALDAALEQAMRSGGKVPYAQRYRSLAPVVESAFDLTTVLRTAIGLRWDAIPADQQRLLLEAFTRFTVATYLANFDAPTGPRLSLLGVVPSGDDRLVQTVLLPADGGAGTRLNYVMRRQDGGWRATDVLLDATISRAAVLRSDFRSLLRSGGPAALIQHLQGKADQLAAQAGGKAVP